LKRRAAVIWIGAAVGAIALVAGWRAIGGFYGATALAFGRNPLRLIPRTREREEQARAHGQAIIDALTQFHAKNGAYPATLDALVADGWLAEVPASGIGDDRFTYRTDPAKGYVLEFFMGPNYEKHLYEGAAGVWRVDQ
jgi:hypothetical protein